MLRSEGRAFQAITQFLQRLSTGGHRPWAEIAIVTLLWMSTSSNDSSIADPRELSNVYSDFLQKGNEVLGPEICHSCLIVRLR